ASILPAHYEELKAITVEGPQISNSTLEKFLSHKDQLEKALVYDEELVNNVE
ncbi:hypothetical protein HAX54_018971, partial [Datura stramonium]|nr:hypothetical protein [Datura stramonium]